MRATSARPPSPRTAEPIMRSPTAPVVRVRLQVVRARLLSLPRFPPIRIFPDGRIQHSNLVTQDPQRVQQRPSSPSPPCSGHIRQQVPWTLWRRPWQSPSGEYAYCHPLVVSPYQTYGSSLPPMITIDQDTRTRTATYLAD